MKFNTTFGHDVELCLLDKKAQKIVSAIPVLGRDKDDKIDLGDEYMYYHDNTLLEENSPVAQTKEEAKDIVKTLFKKIRKHLGKNYDIACVPSYNFTKEECSHEKAMIVGCNAEFCAVNIEQVNPADLSETLLRTAGGHIAVGRVGWEKCRSGDFLLNPMTKINCVRAMDIFVGIPSIVLDNTEASKERKKLYGKCGRHRPKDWGFEYRVLSNFWVKTPKMVDLIYDLTMYSIERAENEDFQVVDINEVVHIIDDNDVDLAKSTIEKVMPKEFIQRIKELA